MKKVFEPEKEESVKETLFMYVRWKEGIFLIMSSFLMAELLACTLPAVLEEAEIPFFDGYYLIQGIIFTNPFLLTSYILRKTFNEEGTLFYSLARTKSVFFIAVFYLIYYTMTYAIEVSNSPIILPDTNTLFELMLLWFVVEAFTISRDYATSKTKKEFVEGLF